MEIHGKQDRGDAAGGRRCWRRRVAETPLLDRSDAAVKELIRSAKKRGYVTHDQINALLSSDEGTAVRSQRSSKPSSAL